MSLRYQAKWGVCPIHVSTLSKLSMGVYLAAVVTVAPTDVSGSYPNAGFWPFELPETVTIAQLWVHVGATVSGNSTDIGIYDTSGNRLVSSGNFVPTASAVNVRDVTDLVLGPGRYYLGLSNNGVISYFTLLGAGPSPDVQFSVGFGILDGSAAANPLPASVTYATLAQNGIIVMGFSLKTTI